MQATPKLQVAFDEMGTLELQPSELHTLHLSTAPLTPIKVLLIGDAFDASLDHGTVTSGQDGQATVTLKAPSQPSSFHVVAHVGDSASADLAVSVSQTGFASVRVLPKYLGKRDVASWLASVSIGSTCDTARAALPLDPAGALTSTAAPGGAPVIASVPAGPTVAVAVRGGAVAWGCVETSFSASTAVADLSIDVTDLPMRLESANLGLRLEFAPPSVSYGSFLSKSEALLINTAFPPTADPAKNLLDAVRTNVPSLLLQSFDQHRQGSNLDAVIDAQLGVAAADPRAAMQQWASAIAPPTGNAPTQLIHGTLAGLKATPDTPTFQVDMFGPVPAASAGVPPSLSLHWVAEPGDTVAVSGNLLFSPTRYAGYLITQRALLATPGSSTASDALAKVVDCTSLGTEIGGFSTCDAVCGTALCGAALSTLWERGVSTADDQGIVTVAISTTATVDAAAIPSALTGSWLGDLTGAGASCSMLGSAAATALPTP